MTLIKAKKLIIKIKSKLVRLSLSKHHIKLNTTTKTKKHLTICSLSLFTILVTLFSFFQLQNYLNRQTNATENPLSISSVSPHVGSVTGGNVININGTGFTTTPKITKISGGAMHSVSLDTDGNIWTWGGNTYGQLGTSNTVNSSSPVQITTSGKYTAIATNYLHSLALDTDGNIWAWGNNGNGQLGTGDTINSSSPVKITTSGGYTTIATGYFHSLALDTDGNIWAWGSNHKGQLGTGNTTSSLTPKKITSSGNYISIDGGELYTLSLDTDGNIWTWGNNQYGQLGTGDTTDSSSPVKITTSGGYTSLTSGYTHSHAVDDNNNIWVWGSNMNGRFGDDTTADSYTPIQVINSSNYVSLATGSAHTLALDTNGKVWAWGFNEYGQLGNGASTSFYTPLQAINSSNYSALSTGYGHTLSLDQSSNIWAWGSNRYGQVGNGDTNNLIIPTTTQVTTSGEYTAITAGAYHSLALDTDGNIWAWGSNDKGQLGNGSTTDTFIPTKTTSSNSFTAITGGFDHSLALDTDGNIWAWGSNGNGQLGTGDTISSSSPLKVTTSGEYTTITAGAYHSLALDTDGNIWAWGSNDKGQLGTGDTTDSSSPVRITNSNNFTATAGGFNYSLALDTDGNIWTWGNNQYGQLGTGDTTDSSSPVQITTSGKYTAIATNYLHSLALDTDGNIWAWGYNQLHQLGNGNTTNSLAPIKITDSGVYTAIFAGDQTSVALDSNNNIWGWGYNISAQYTWQCSPDNNTGMGNCTSPVQTTFPPTSTSSISSIAIGGIGIPSYTVNSNTSITLTTPAHATGLVDITISTIDGKTATLNSGYTYTSPPTITSVSPDSGVTSGNTEITIEGTNLSFTDSILLGTAACNNIVIINDTKVTCTSSANPYGSVDITITLIDGQSTTVANAFTYTLPPPTITSINPNSGPISGGTTVEIAGNNFNIDFVHVAAGQYFSIAIDAAGNLFTWGQNSLGQIGDELNIARQTPYQVNGGVNSGIDADTRFKAIAAGYAHSLAIDTKGNLYAWGGNAYGQVGNGSTSSDGINTPQKIDTSTIVGWEANDEFIAVAAGQYHSLALTKNGIIYSWGYNKDRQTGTGASSSTNILVPTKVSGAPNSDITSSTKVTTIASGNAHSMAIDIEGNLYVWGDNGSRQAGNTVNGTDQPVPLKINGVSYGIPESTKFKAVAGGYYHSVVVDTEGNLYTWGFNNQGQIGNGITSSASQTTIYQINGSPESGIESTVRFKTVGASNYQSMAIATNGDLYVWGFNDRGQLGDGTTTTPVTMPKKITGGPYFDISCGWYHTLATTTSGDLYAWGRNNLYQLGVGNSSQSQLSPYNLQISNPIISSLSFDTLNATSFTVNSDTSITAVTPAHTAGLVDTTFTTIDNQTIVINDSYAYQLPDPPVITSISPNIGNTAGNTTIEITGSGFLTGLQQPAISSIMFGNTEASSFTVNSDTSITAITPAHTAGLVTITLTAIDGQIAALDDSYTYVGAPSAPTLDSITQNTSTLTLGWTAPSSDGGSVITGYKIEVSTDQGSTWSTVISNTNNTNTTYEFAYSASTPEYTFRISAINIAGVGSASNTLSYQTTFVNLSTNNNLIGINLSPSSSGATSSKRHTVSFTTNNPLGASLAISTNQNHNNLTHTSDLSRTISSTTGTMSNPLVLSPNTWGFAIPNSSTNISNGFNATYLEELNNTSSTSRWAAIPNNSQAPLVIKTSNIANPTTANSTDIFYGSNINYSPIAGTYTTQIIYTAITN